MVPHETTSPGREFRLSAELRRCGLYWCVGSVLITATAACLALFGPARQQPAPNGGPSPVMGSIVAGVVTIGSALVLYVGNSRFRIRIDGRGISRRRLWRWELWPWAAFRDGQVEPGDTNDSFRSVIPGAPPRVLSIGSLDEESRRFIRAIVRENWRPRGSGVTSGETPTVQIAPGSRLRFARQGLILRSPARVRQIGRAHV